MGRTSWPRCTWAVWPAQDNSGYRTSAPAPYNLTNLRRKLRSHRFLDPLPLFRLRPSRLTSTLLRRCLWMAVHCTAMLCTFSIYHTWWSILWYVVTSLVYWKISFVIFNEFLNSKASTYLGNVAARGKPLNLKTVTLFLTSCLKVPYMPKIFFLVFLLFSDKLQHPIQMLFSRVLG